jgi:Sulfotransferase family
LAVYSAQYKFIFFANPQTASKAVAKTLRDKLGGKRLPERELTRNGRVIAQVHHTTYDQIVEAGLLTAQELEGLYKVTSIRNPFDMLVSKYLKYCERFGSEPSKFPWLSEVPGTLPENGFAYWLRWLGKRYEEMDKIARGPMAFIEHADQVLRFEALQQGFDEFMQHIGVTEPLSVTEWNVTQARKDEQAPVAPQVPKKKKKNYTEYYDDESVAFVQRLYEPILARFDYRFGQ